MRKNILSVGARTITGDTGKIIAAGELSIIDSGVQIISTSLNKKGME